MKTVRRNGRKNSLPAAPRSRRPKAIRPPRAADFPDAASSWESRLCELELRLTQLQSENDSLRSALQQSEARGEIQAKLQDFAAVGLFTLDPRGMIQDVNKTGAAMLAFKRVQLLRRSFASLVQPEDQPAFTTHLRQCGRSRKPVAATLTLSVAGGRFLTAQLSSVPVLDHKSRVTQVKTTVIDITQHNQAEKALLTSEQNLRALIDASPHPIQFKDGAGRWQLANPAMLNLFGLTGADYHNKTDAQLAAQSPPFRNALERHRRKDGIAMAASRTTRQDEAILNPDGSVRIFDFIKVPLRRANGQLQGLVTLGYDITDRKQDEQRIKELNRDLRRHAEKLEERVRQRTAQLNRLNKNLQDEILAHQQAEKALRESETRLQGIMNHTPSIIFLKDVQGRYLHVNQQYSKEFKRRLDETVGKTDSELFPPDQAAMFRANDQAVVLSGAPIVFDEVADFPDGLHTSIVTKFPLFDENGKVYAVGGIVTDITDRKRLQEEILQISEREQRRIAQDLHDGLGQQLTGLWCLNEVLRKNLRAKSSRYAADTARISAQLKSAVAMTRSLAQGLHPVEAESGGLMSALKNLAARVKTLFKVSCEFLCPNAVPIEDPSAATQLYRIAQEAVTNSIKHGRAQKIKIGLSAPSELIILTVSDDGVGFGKSSRPSRGLGLRIMSHRARLIGGMLIVQQKAEGGVKVVCAVGKTVAPETGSKPKSAANHGQEITQAAEVGSKKNLPRR